MHRYFYFNSFIRNSNLIPKSKFTIKILCNDRFEPFIHQQCNYWGIFNDVKFVTSGEADLIIVLNKYDGLNEYKSCATPIYLWLIEPPDYLDLYTEHLDLSIFDRIFTCKYLKNYPQNRQIITPPFVHWHHAYNSKSRFLKNGFMPFDFLRNRDVKNNQLNRVFVLDSHINKIPGHESRIRLIENISSNKFDLYGSQLWDKHSNYVSKLSNFKFRIQENYKCSLVIENQKDDIYWSEKITDSFLSYSFPIYFGSKSVSEFFPENSYYYLDNLEISSNELCYISDNIFDLVNINSIAEARKLVLFDYNIFNIFSKFSQ